MIANLLKDFFVRYQFEFYLNMKQSNANCIVWTCSWMCVLLRMSQQLTVVLRSFSAKHAHQTRDLNIIIRNHRNDNETFSKFKHLIKY